MKALDRLISQPVEKIARLGTAQNHTRTSALASGFDNRPTWDNWSNRGR